MLNQGGVVGGTPTADLSWENHGTAVHGEIGGDENNLGIVGIAPKTKFSAVSIFGQGNSPAKAIKTAADRLQPGDIILIELHRQGPGASGQGQDGFIPIEWWPADFDATKYATSKGVIVIAAAGNGARNLDDAIYQQRFDRSVMDSGSLLVGGGAPPSGNHGPDRSRLGFSNYGASVDAQGWGREVTTAGYGDLQASSDKNKIYTAELSGTSSSAPIVVGAAACLQSIEKTANNTVLGYLQLREVMRNTGSPQIDARGRPKSQRARVPLAHSPRHRPQMSKRLRCCPVLPPSTGTKVSLTHRVVPRVFGWMSMAGKTLITHARASKTRFNERSSAPTAKSVSGMRVPRL